MINYLSVSKEQVPLLMLLNIEDEQYTFEFDYNAKYDYFSVSLSRNGTLLVQGEKIVLDRPLFATINNPFEFTTFIPMDIAGLEQFATYSNLNDTVFILQGVVEWPNNE